MWGRSRAAVVDYGGSMTVDDFLVWLGKTERELPMNTLRDMPISFKIVGRDHFPVIGATVVDGRIELY